MLALSFGAWVLILARPHAHHHGAGARFGAGLTSWMLMVIAMMIPTLIAPARFAAFRSLWPRRHRAILGLLLGYVAVWTLAGLVWQSILALTGWSAGPLASAIAFAVAAAWQITSAKRRSLKACHRSRPLSPVGWRADLDCVAYGLAHGAQCVVSCWLLMIAAMLPARSAPAMIAVAVICIVERYSLRLKPTSVPLALSLASAGFLIAARV
jgi:predicted metal-binding membrane protein